MDNVGFVNSLVRDELSKQTKALNKHHNTVFTHKLDFPSLSKAMLGYLEEK